MNTQERLQKTYKDITKNCLIKNLRSDKNTKKTLRKKPIVALLDGNTKLIDRQSVTETIFAATFTKFLKFKKKR